MFRAGTQTLCLHVWQTGAFEIQDCLRHHGIHRDLDRRSDVSTTVQLKKLLLLGIATSGSDILFYLYTHTPEKPSTKIAAETEIFKNT